MTSLIALATRFFALGQAGWSSACWLSAVTRALSLRSTIVPLTSARVLSVCSFAIIVFRSDWVPSCPNRLGAVSVRMTVFSCWAGWSFGFEPMGTIPAHVLGSAVIRRLYGCPVAKASLRPLTRTYIRVLPQLFIVMLSGASPSFVDPPMRLTTCAFAYASGLKAEGEKAEGLNADGENADGLNADGENADGLKADGLNADGEKADGEKAEGLNADGEKADGENADGLKADGASEAPSSSALRCSRSSSSDTEPSAAAMSLKTNMS